MVKAKDQQQKEKRAHRRLEISLPLAYRRTDSPRASSSHTYTINVSTGGLYFETTDEELRMGDKLVLELNVPEGDERFPPHSRIKTTGRVVRSGVAEPDKSGEIGLGRVGIGAQFEQGLKLVF